MLDLVKQQYVIEAYDLSQEINKRLNLGTGYHIIFSALADMHEFSINESYVEVRGEFLRETDGLCEGWDENDNYDLSKVNFNELTINQKVNYEIIKMMEENLLPEKFILLISW